MGEPSMMVFHIPNGTIVPATTKSKLLHHVHEPARSVSIVPALLGNALLNTNKFAEAGYTAIYDNAMTRGLRKSQSQRRQSSLDGDAPIKKIVACPTCSHGHKPKHGHSTAGPSLRPGQSQCCIRCQHQSGGP
jgi:hypothetical protein